jgi:hypothetical protein
VVKLNRCDLLPPLSLFSLPVFSLSLTRIGEPALPHTSPPPPPAVRPPTGLGRLKRVRFFKKIAGFISEKLIKKAKIRKKNLAHSYAQQDWFPPLACDSRVFASPTQIVVQISPTKIALPVVGHPRSKAPMLLVSGCARTVRKIAFLMPLWKNRIFFTMNKLKKMTLRVIVQNLSKEELMGLRRCSRPWTQTPAEPSPSTSSRRGSGDMD